MTEYIYEITKDSDGVDCYIKRGEIVRCRECKYYEETDARIGTCLLTVCGANIDGFCAWAERKETEDDKSRMDK